MSTFVRLNAENVNDAFRLINDAYSVELGDSGVAFKKTDRYPSIENLRAEMSDKDARWIGRMMDSVLVGVARVKLLANGDATAGSEDADGVAAALVGAPLSASKNVATLGPFAVASSTQGKGVGSALLAEVERVARDELHANELQIELVNVRTDLLGYYAKRGFANYATADADVKHFCDPTKVTRNVHFILQRKKLT